MNFKNRKVIAGIVFVLAAAILAGYGVYSRFGHGGEDMGAQEEVNISGNFVKFEDSQMNAELQAVQWIDLGLKRKAEEDYEGARDAWQKAVEIDPNSSVSFRNLGVIYGYYLNDPQKAEKNFLISIEKDPQLAYLYVTLYDFYRDVLRDPEKAKSVLQKGISAGVDTSEAFRALLENLNNK